MGSELNNRSQQQGLHQSSSTGISVTDSSPARYLQKTLGNIAGLVKSTAPSSMASAGPSSSINNSNSGNPLMIAAPSIAERQKAAQVMRGYVPFDPEKEVKHFWPKQRDRIEDLTNEQLREATKTQILPLARIKKIMKIDDDVKAQMISAEAPVLFAKACEIFIEELTIRSWLHTEDNKRKTLQKNDIAMAIAKYEQFDFLIDIVPREENKISTNSKRNNESGPTAENEEPGSPTAPMLINDNQLQYYISVPGPNGTQQLIQAPNISNMGNALPTQVQLQNGQIVQATPVGQPIQLQANPGQTMQLIAAGGGSHSNQPIELQVLPHGSVQLAADQDLQSDELGDEEMG